MEENNIGISINSITTGEATIKGCKDILNFLPESNGKAIDTVKKITVAKNKIKT